VGRRAALSRTRRDTVHASGQPSAATQRRAAQGVTLRGGVTRDGCGPLCSFELNQARRYARSRTAKSRDAANELRKARRFEVEGREAAVGRRAALS